MTACGYCCCYSEHCSKTDHIAIKEVIRKRFGLVAYEKHPDFFLAPHKIC